MLRFLNPHSAVVSVSGIGELHCCESCGFSGSGDVALAVFADSSLFPPRIATTGQWSLPYKNNRVSMSNGHQKVHTRLPEQSLGCGLRGNKVAYFAIKQNNQDASLYFASN